MALQTFVPVYQEESDHHQIENIKQYRKYNTIRQEKNRMLNPPWRFFRQSLRLPKCHRMPHTSPKTDMLDLVTDDGVEWRLWWSVDMAVQSVIVVEDPRARSLSLSSSSSWIDITVVKNAPRNLGDGWLVMKAGAPLWFANRPGHPSPRGGYSTWHPGTLPWVLFGDNLAGSGQDFQLWGRASGYAPASW